MKTIKRVVDSDSSSWPNQSGHHSHQGDSGWRCKRYEDDMKTIKRGFAPDSRWAGWWVGDAQGFGLHNATHGHLIAYTVSG
jgi:hypothetical protein